MSEGSGRTKGAQDQVQSVTLVKLGLSWPRGTDPRDLFST